MNDFNSDIAVRLRSTDSQSQFLSKKNVPYSSNAQSFNLSEDLKEEPPIKGRLSSAGYPMSYANNFSRLGSFGITTS